MAFSKSTFVILMQHALLKRTSLINHKDSWWMHWTERVFILFAFKKGRKHWGDLWVSNCIGMLILITRVGVILMEPTEFPIALPNCPESCGDVKIPYPSLWCKWRFVTWKIKLEIFPSIVTRRLVNHNHQRLETSLLQNVSIPCDMDILMSNSIDWHKLTMTQVYASGKQYEIISQCSQFFQIFFCWA